MIHLVYCIDKNYLMPTLVSAASAAIWATEAHPQTIHIVIDSNPVQELTQFVSQLKKLNPRFVQVEVHLWDGIQFDCFQKWHGTSIIYARLELPNILPTVDHVISLDGDTLWLDDPWKLDQLFDNRKMMQASLDPPPPSGGENPVFKRWFAKYGLTMDPKQYLCVGLTILNLKLMRERGLSKQAVEFLQTYPNPECPEQIVLSYLTQGLNVPLPPAWGVFSVCHKGVDLSQPALIHYVQDAPWKRIKVTRLFSDVVLLWFDFCRIVLEKDVYRETFTGWTRLWRRSLFVILKKYPWICCCAYLRARFRNICGISEEVRVMICQRWRNCLEELRQ